MNQDTAAIVSMAVLWGLFILGIWYVHKSNKSNK